MAPFCPPEVAGSVPVDPNASFFKRVLRFAGPGLLVSIGYMDPGNWATAIEAGSRFGYSLLFVVLFAGVVTHLWVRAGPERAVRRGGVRRRLPHR